MNSKTFKKLGLLGLFIAAFIFLFSWSAQGNVAADDSKETAVEIDPALLADITDNGRAGYHIVFNDKADLSPAYDMSWEARGQFVVDALQATAEASQKNVRAYLDSQNVPYQHFWAENIIIVESSEIAVFNTLTTAFPEINSIVARPEIILYEPDKAAANIELEKALDLLVVEPNIAQVSADDAWGLGVDGTGIVVANIDTGVRYTHEALVNQYRGNLGGGTFDHNYNWWDPNNPTTFPTDTNGHGTHTMGTTVGDDGNANQIGVAPGAQWIACRSFAGGSVDASLLECGQFMLAPWDLNEANPDPTLRPHVVNNSWGDCGQTYDTFYESTITAWHAAGIYPVFSNGNASNCGYSAPPGLNTVGNPARSGNVSGVGSSGTNNGQYASHSNWGPTDNLDTVNPVAGWEDLKPQFLAPGVSIRSSVPTSDTAYESAGWSGTSMSSPHVTGGIALIWQAASCLVGDYATTETILEETATPIIYDDGSGPRTPNYAAGWGEINLLAAVQQAQAMCGPSGTVTGTVVDTATSNPIEGASVTITFGGDSSSATTDSNGQYTLNFIPAGTGYVVDAAAFGYLPDTATVDVVADQTTVQDFALTQAPSHTVSGVVTDATTGWPLYASIAIGGADIDPIWTNPETGTYSIVLPEGINYTFEVAAWVSGYVNESRAVGPLTADLTEDFGLNIDVVSCSAPGYGPDPSSTIYFEAFDTSDGGFTMTSGTSWAWGTPITWPAACTSGTSCWGTNLNGTYPASANEILVSPSIDLTAVAPGTPLVLTWQQANHIENATYDHGYAEVSTDGGTTWTTMWEHTGETSQVLWRQLTYDLSSAAGNNVLLRWRLTSDSSVQYNGLYIDDIFIGSPACIPAAGGLLVGNVYNGNTGEPFVGATVTTDATSVSTVATPNDDNVDDGFYTVFVAEGTSDVTASYTGFTDETVSVTIADGTTTEQDFSLGSGALTITPSSVEFNVELGSSDTESVVFENTGSASIDFALSSPAINEEFEGIFAPTGWTVVNNGGACDWVTNSDVGRPNHAGGNGISAAADSDTCGSGSTMDTELISPPFSLAGATVADLDFILSYRHLSTSSFSVKASVDGGSNWDVLQTWTADESAQGPGTPVNIDLSAYLGQSSVLVSFHYQAPGWHWWTQIDNVVIVSDSSWLTASPSTGTIAAGATQTVDISVDTAVFATPGTYTGAINVSHTGPDPEPSQIPVTVNVTAPATLALLEGTVSSQGACDSNPFPIAGAEVVVTNGTDSWTPITDSNGYYFVYIDESYSPVDIAVTAVDHEGDSATGVVLIGQQTTTQDFDLRWLQPCIDVSATELTATLVLGDVDTTDFTINNSGGADLTFELRELDGGFSPRAEGISWETMAPLPSGRVFNAVVADQNGYIYVIGGTSDGGATIPTTTNFRYNTATNSWDTMAAMPTAVDSIDGVEVNGKIYIPGGDTSANTYVYDIASDSWSTIAANNGYSPRSQYQVVAIDNNVYVLGGIVAAASASTTEVWVLDTTTGTWSAGVPMQKSRTSFAAGVVDGQIYVAGGVLFPGFTPDMTTEKFDGTSWSYAAPVPNGGGAYTRWSYQADGVGENGLWLAAGRRDADWNALDHAGYYDPSTDTWTDTPAIPTLSQARVYMEGDVASDGYFYVIGGRDGGGAIAYDINERIYVGLPAGGDVPWLDETPLTGTVAADGGSEEIQVTFDASVVDAPGQYFATLRVASNDPTTPQYNIPVTLNVVASGNVGQLTGLVQSLGACDTTPAPLVGAEVVVTSGSNSWTATTNASGVYSIWVDESDSPVDVAVSAANHTSASATGIVIIGGQTTTENFDLRAISPCVSVDQTAYDVTVMLGESTTRDLTITNSGAGAATFSFSNLPVSLNQVVVELPASTGTTTSGQRQPANGYAPAQTLTMPQGLVGGGAYDVLVVTPDSDVQDLISVLNGFSDITATVYSGDISTVTAADFAPYDVVLLTNNNQWAASGADVSVGNALADYVDAGGKVIIGNYAFDNVGWELGGRYITGGYGPFSTATGDMTGSSSLGTIHEPAHPVMAGVTTITNSYLWQQLPVSSGATRLADWNDGTVLAAINEHSLALNVLLSAGDGSSMGWTGDLGTLIHNAVVFFSDSTPPVTIDWLSQSPDTGTVAADDSALVSVIFDTTVLTQTGVYEAIMRVNTDDPTHSTIDIPVTMTVIDGGNIGVELSPETDTAVGAPGTTVTYTLSVTNLGDYTDTFNLAASGNNWSVDLVPATITVNSGDTAIIVVLVHIPASAADGDADVVTLTATSSIDPTVSDSSVFTTTAEEGVVPPTGYTIYLPVIIKP